MLLHIPHNYPSDNCNFNSRLCGIKYLLYVTPFIMPDVSSCLCFYGFNAGAVNKYLSSLKWLFSSCCLVLFLCTIFRSCLQMLAIMILGA